MCGRELPPIITYIIILSFETRVFNEKKKVLLNLFTKDRIKRIRVAINLLLQHRSYLETLKHVCMLSCITTASNLRLIIYRGTAFSLTTTIII